MIFNVLEDGQRQGDLEKYGVSFLRFSNEEVFDDVQAVLNKIKRFIDENK